MCLCVVDGQQMHAYIRECSTQTRMSSIAINIRVSDKPMEFRINCIQFNPKYIQYNDDAIACGTSTIEKRMNRIRPSTAHTHTQILIRNNNKKKTRLLDKSIMSSVYMHYIDRESAVNDNVCFNCLCKMWFYILVFLCGGQRHTQKTRARKMHFAKTKTKRRRNKRQNWVKQHLVAPPWHVVDEMHLCVCALHWLSQFVIYITYVWHFNITAYWMFGKLFTFFRLRSIFFLFVSWLFHVWCFGHLTIIIVHKLCFWSGAVIVLLSVLLLLLLLGLLTIWLKLQIVCLR